jgi:hypothetical protein
VATDQTSRVLVDESAEAPPAIENELPTYRAISTRAIFSLICGILASFSFANLFLLIFAALAVVLGVLANLAIKRHPDMLTGRGLANAGIALGLVFGLVTATYTGVQSFVLTQAASKFGREYAEAVQSGSLGKMLWYNLHPDMRKNKSPEETLREFETAKAKERMMMDQKTAPVQSLRKRLVSSKDETFHFVDIETQGLDEGPGKEIGYFATALFEVEGPGNKDFPEKKQHALAIFKGRTKGRHYEWWVEDVKYPYQPRSFKAPEKPVGDGHDHGGGH